MNRIKVLIFASELSGYNIACFNCISERYDLSVAFFDKDKSSIPCTFQKINLSQRRIGPFTCVKGARKLARQFDVVCFPPDLHFISYWGMAFLPKSFKLINWGIGFRVSYHHPYIVNRKHTILDWFTKVIQNKCDASIFYMEKAKEFWNNTNYKKDRIFVAINTTDVAPICLAPDFKKELLFVGTLYKGKGVDTLLDIYSQLQTMIKDPLHLTIVGDGAEKPTLQRFVSDHHLEEYISFVGAVYDESTLSKYFEKALICLSPNQAGLSVLKSMGYGVPFVTKRNAITGGEIFNITDGVDGVLYEKDEDLLQILLDASNNPGKFIDMGEQAKQYYDNNATVYHQANGFIEAIEFVLNNKRN